MADADVVGDGEDVVGETSTTQTQSESHSPISSAGNQTKQGVYPRRRHRCPKKLPPAENKAEATRGEEEVVRGSSETNSNGEKESRDSGDPTVLIPAKAKPPTAAKASSGSVSFQWKRQTMQRWCARINLRVRSTVLRDIKSRLVVEGGNEALNKFRAGVFGKLLDLRRKSSANNALHELMARELHDDTLPKYEKWFRIGGKNIRFSYPEYILVTGLNLRGSNFDPNAHHEIPPGSLYHRCFGGKRTKFMNVLYAFGKGKLHHKKKKIKGKWVVTVTKTEKHVDDYLKAAHIVMYYAMLYCREPETFVEDWVWALIEDENQWEVFPWGWYSFQILLHYIEILAKDPSQVGPSKKAYHFCGPVWALQIWACDTIDNINSVLSLQLCTMQLCHSRTLNNVLKNMEFDDILEHLPT